MKYEDMSFLKKLFHSHEWEDPTGDKPTTCFKCGYQPSCIIHGCKMYTHGYYSNIDCLECREECYRANGYGIDYSKDNIYDAIGQPDLKPKE